LYITTGDAKKPDQAQNLNYLGEKILRINDNGTIPPTIHFPIHQSTVWVIVTPRPTWDDQGRLWSTEHGRSIPQSGYDELNLIAAGQNLAGQKFKATNLKPGWLINNQFGCGFYLGAEWRDLS
jgi:glucose/arabinose dehydrogenase